MRMRPANVWYLHNLSGWQEKAAGEMSFIIAYFKKRPLFHPFQSNIFETIIKGALLNTTTQLIFSTLFINKILKGVVKIVAFLIMMILDEVYHVKAFQSKFSLSNNKVIFWNV